MRKSASVFLNGNQLVAIAAVQAGWRIVLDGGGTVEGGGSDAILKDYQRPTIVDLIWESSGGTDWPARFEVIDAAGYGNDGFDYARCPRLPLTKLTSAQAAHALQQLVDEFPKFWFEKNPSAELRAQVGVLRRRAVPGLFERLSGWFGK